MKMLTELKRLADYYGVDYDVNMEGHPAHHFQYVANYIPQELVSLHLKSLVDGLKSPGFSTNYFVINNFTKTVDHFTLTHLHFSLNGF